MDVRVVGIKHLQIILEVEKKASYIVSEADENVACPLHNPADESNTFVFPSHLLWRLSPYTANDFIQWISQRQLWYMESGEIKKNKTIPQNSTSDMFISVLTRDSLFYIVIDILCLACLVMLRCNSRKAPPVYTYCTIFWPKNKRHDFQQSKLCCSSIRDDEDAKRDRVTRRGKETGEWRERPGWLLKICTRLWKRERERELWFFPDRKEGINLISVLWSPHCFNLTSWWGKEKKLSTFARLRLPLVPNFSATASLIRRGRPVGRAMPKLMKTSWIVVCVFRDGGGGGIIDWTLLSILDFCLARLMMPK